MNASQKLDKLLSAMRASHQAMMATLDEEEDEDEEVGLEDKLTAAMVRAITMTKSRNRTFGTNGGYAA